jgi:hypothetical protein
LTAHREPPRIFTAANRPLCRSYFASNQEFIHLAIVGWLKAGETGKPVPPEDEQLVRDALAAVVLGEHDPRKVFGWPPPNKKRPDKRYKKDVWREQWMAAETLRLVNQNLADDEDQAKVFVADAFDVDEIAVRRALKEWRHDLESGDLIRYLASLK